MEIIKRVGKIALLIFGLLPVVFFILAFTILEPGEGTTDLLFTILFILTAISIPGAPIFYIVNVYRNKSVIKGQKHLWAALLFFRHVLVYPFCWYLYVWRKPNKTTENESERPICHAT